MAQLGNIVAAEGDDIEREARLVQEAIALVASGASVRVVLAGVRRGDALLPLARRLAFEAGLRIVALEDASGSRIDIAVERVRP